MVPSARRIKDRTITIRVKEVTMIRIAGARERTVMSRKICKTTVGAPDCPLVSIPIEKKGVEMPGSAPQLLPARIKIKHTRITEAVQPGFKRLPAVKARRKIGPHPVPSTVGFLIVCLKLWINTFYLKFLTTFC